jgi:hypothetical protein
MTIETEVADLTSATNALLGAVATQQTGVNVSVGMFNSVITRVNSELNLVNNTADVDKVVSIPQQAAIDLKQDTLVSGTSIATINGLSLLEHTELVIARGMQEMPVTLYSDRASLRAPTEPLPQTGDIENIQHLGVFQYVETADNTIPYFDDDEMVFEAVDPDDNTIILGQWVMALPGYEFTKAQEMFENALLWDWMEDSDLRELIEQAY